MARHRRVSNVLIALWLVLGAAVGLVREAAANNDPGGGAKVRAVHAVYDAPAVDIFFGSTKVLTTFAYFSVSSYVDAAAGPGALHSAGALH